jgi:hypothetical protein
MFKFEELERRQGRDYTRVRKIVFAPGKWIWGWLARVFTGRS